MENNKAPERAELTWKNCADCRPDSLEDCRKCWNEWESNTPLTLTELRGMDGEPVWVVFEPDADADRLTMWALVNIIGNEVELRNNLGGHSALRDSMTVDENHVDIYRRPPEGGGE